MRWEVYHTVTGEVLQLALTRAGAMAAIVRLASRSPLDVRPIGGWPEEA